MLVWPREEPSTSGRGLPRLPEAQFGFWTGRPSLRSKGRKGLSPGWCFFTLAGVGSWQQSAGQLSESNTVHLQSPEKVVVGSSCPGLWQCQRWPRLFSFGA